jgi:CxxC-x17-CxxC domain-containing protein
MSDRRKPGSQFEGAENQQEDGQEEQERWEIVCSICGEEDTVPFEPRRNATLYCRECHKVRKEKINKGKVNKAPRIKHNTRVSFPITCSQCGQEETLDYVPKGLKLSEALCSDCVRSTYGEKSRWHEINESKQQEKKGEWDFECAECGRQDYLKFEPDPEEDYLCVRCFNEHENPKRERQTPKKRVGRAVYVRKKDDDAN